MASKNPSWGSPRSRRSSTNNPEAFGKGTVQFEMDEPRLSRENATQGAREIERDAKSFNKRYADGDPN